MIAAILNGLVGLGLCLGIGITYFNLSLVDVLLAVFHSNLAAVIALLVTLRAENTSWVPKVFIKGPLKTWTWLASLYTSIILLLSPPLREFGILLPLYLPLILSTGFGILIFGPIQDQVVRRQQLRNSTK